MAARSLGTLTLDLIAKIGGFEAGLGKAEREAVKRAKAIEKVFDAAGTAAGVAFSAALAGAIAGAAVFDTLIKKVGDFQDIAEKTGGSAEGFASFAVAAATAGVEMNTVASASIRLTHGLTAVDDESKAAGAAIEALGLNIKEFKGLAPEDQIEAVAKALGEFEDGAGKTAAAVALFGKAGAELLPFLKELEAQGGRQVKLTSEQIQLADEYADSQARIAAEISQQAQLISAEALPAVNGLLQAISDLTKDQDFAAVASGVLTGAFSAALTVVQALTVLVSDLGFVFVGVGREIGAVAAQLVALARLDFQGFRAISEAVKEDGKRARAELEKFQARILSIGNQAPLDDEARRRLGRGVGLPALKFEGAQTGNKEKAKQSEADRYLETLQKQLEKTQDLTVAEQVLIDITSGRLGKVTAAQKDSLLLTARQIDAAKEFEKIIELRRAAAAAEGDAVLAVNKAYQDRLQTLMNATPSAMLEKQRADVRLLTEEYEAGRISEAAYLEAVTARLDLVAEKTKEANDFAKDLGLTFTSAFEDAIVSGKSLGDVLKSLIADIAKIVVRKTVTEPIGNAVTDIFKSGDGFGSLLKVLGIGTRADGGHITAGSPYIVGERGPEMIVPSMSGTVIPNHAMAVQGGGKSFTYAPSIRVDGQLDTARTEQMIQRQLRAGFAEFTDRMEISG